MGCEQTPSSSRFELVNKDKFLAAKKAASATWFELAGGMRGCDLKIGEGPEAERGILVGVHFEGFRLNGRLIESSWQQGPQPLYIEAGHSPEFPALGEGVIGMHEGGRRELVVPPKMNREGSEEVMTYTIELFMVSKQRGASTSRVDVRSGAILSPSSPTIRNK